MRRLGTILFVTTLTFGLAACGGGSDTGQDVLDQPVTLRFMWWGSDARHQRTQQVIELFQKEHPNITVKGEFTDWNGYWESLADAVAADDVPDIVQMDELYLASYAERGALLDLDTTTNQLKTTDFDANALATGQVDGKLYALPVGLAAYSVVVNTDLLAKYDVPLPDDSTWTWDDLKLIGGQISKASGGKVTGVQAFGFDTGSLNIWARQNGASLYDDKGNVAIPPTVLASYWSYLVDLAKTGASPAASVTIKRANASLDQSGVATNASAFGTWWNTQLTSLSAASGAKLKLLNMPGEAASPSPGAYYKPSMFWSISARSKHPTEAALFVDFLSNKEAAGKVLLTDRGVPANIKVRTTITPQLAETDQAAVAYLDALKVGQALRVTPNGASSVEAILKRHTEEVLLGRATPAQAATAFIKELQTEIDDA